jgi:nucleoside-diphosphate-sugar epimerase
MPQPPRVVVTSSTAALRGPGDRPARGGLYSEEDWNESSRPDGPGMEAYQYAKTAAERLGKSPCVFFLLFLLLVVAVRGWGSHQIGCVL